MKITMKTITMSLAITSLALSAPMVAQAHELTLEAEVQTIYTPDPSVDLIDDGDYQEMVNLGIGYSAAHLVRDLQFMFYYQATGSQRRDAQHHRHQADARDHGNERLAPAGQHVALGNGPFE